MEIASKDFELAAICISIAAGCIPCTAYHIKEAIRLGADDDSVVAAVRSGAGVADVALMDIWERFDPEVTALSEEKGFLQDSRAILLGSVGAAAARNDVRLFQQNIERCREEGIPDQEIMGVVGLAESIKDKAASHLDRIIKGIDADRAIARSAASLCT